MSEQGQEIDGNGRRIDELDQFILLGAYRTNQLSAHSQNMKEEHETLLKAEANKLLIARRELDERNPNSSAKNS